MIDRMARIGQEDIVQTEYGRLEKQGEIREISTRTRKREFSLATKICDNKMKAKFVPLFNKLILSSCEH